MVRVYEDLDALSRAAPQELLYLLSVGLTAGPGFLDLLSVTGDPVWLSRAGSLSR